MSTTANVMITRALQLIGVIAAGEVPSADDYADGLITLNDMVAAWATEPLTIYTITRVTKVLTASTQTYTIGTGATINTPRPLWIASAAVIPVGQTFEIQVDVLSDEDWAAISVKDVTSTFPSGIYYDYGFDSSGFGRISVWPIQTTAPTLVLNLPSAIATFTNGTTSVSFPPGYERMLRYNLALELAPEYGKPLDPVIASVAVISKANIKRANSRHSTLRVDSALQGDGSGGAYNWWTD